MKYRHLGNTPFNVSEIGVGTAALGASYGLLKEDETGPPPEKDAIRLLREAETAGVNFFDTAPNYGTAERLLGEAFSGRENIVISTKVSTPAGQDGGALTGGALDQVIRTSLDRSRRHLKRQTLDIVQIHNATLETFARGELIEILERARDRGEIISLGATVYLEDEALTSIENGLDLVQVPFNLLDQAMAKKVFPLAESSGAGLVARSALLKGSLTPRASLLPRELSGLLDSIQRARQTLEVSWEELPLMAIRFCLSHAEIHATLLGVRNDLELKQALKAVACGPLSSMHLQQSQGFDLQEEEHLVNPSQWPLP